MLQITIKVILFFHLLYCILRLNFLLPDQTKPIKSSTDGHYQLATSTTQQMLISVPKRAKQTLACLKLII